MRQFNKFKGTKGWLSLWKDGIRWRSMRNQKEVERRVKILTFWNTHGTKATKDAFNVSERTLYRWQNALKGGRGKLPSLDPRSTTPHKKRIRTYPDGLTEVIIKSRKEHPRIGKKKLTPLLCKQGYKVSESYIGRTLSDLKKRGLLPKYSKLSLYAKTGHLVERKVSTRKKIRRNVKQGLEIDTIVRFVNGTKRYIYTAINVHTRFAFAGAYTNHSSSSATDFLKKVIVVSPDPVTEIQTDNGSEFALHFHDECVKRAIIHYNTYPRCPKMNSFIERFNRTLSEEFIMHHRNLLSHDVKAFNERLIVYLLWYNGERPHESLSLVSPLEYIVSRLSITDCHMWWTCTIV